MKKLLMMTLIIAMIMLSGCSGLLGVPVVPIV